MFSLNTFLQSKNDADMRVALDETSNGVQFFLNLDQAPPDIFFIPGLIKAGMARIAVIVAQDPNFFTTRPDYVSEIQQMVSLLGSMITVITNTVNAAHTTNEQSHTIRCSAIPEVVTKGPQTVQAQAAQPQSGATRNVFVTDGYSHEENGGVLAFSDAQQGNFNECEQPSGMEGQARNAAIQARDQGVTDELAYIGVPGFQNVLQDWKTVVNEARDQ